MEGLLCSLRGFAGEGRSFKLATSTPLLARARLISASGTVSQESADAVATEVSCAARRLCQDKLGFDVICIHFDPALHHGWICSVGRENNQARARPAPPLLAETGLFLLRTKGASIWCAQSAMAGVRRCQPPLIDIPRLGRVHAEPTRLPSHLWRRR